MTLDQSLSWAVDHPLAVASAAGLLLTTTVTVCWIVVHKTSGAVLTAGVGALVCTVYTADTSWRFAEDRLGMTDSSERMVMFAAGEIALLACAVMARANKRATAIDGSAGTPGVPGVLVWCITGVQIIPAFAESGVWGGVIRATFGPVMAGLLWHLAMGLEIRVARPEALSSGLPAQIGAELRERLLSHLGLATRGRTAIEISRDRATARAVRLASRRRRGWWGRAALKASVARSGAAVDGGRRHDLMQLVAARRTAGELATVPVTSPWIPQPTAQPYPATPLGVTGDQLRRMHPMEAIQLVREAHPDATPAELAAISTEYGVTATEGMIRIALHPAAQSAAHPPILAVQPQPQSQSVPALASAEPDTDRSAAEFDSAAASAVALVQPTGPQPDAQSLLVVEASPTAMAHVAPGDALVLDLAPMLAPHPDMCAPAPDAQPPDPVPDADAQPASPQAKPPAVSTPGPARSREPVAQLRTPTADAQLLGRARTLNAKSLKADGKKAPLRLLQTELGIGQRRAQRIQAQLPDTLTDAVAQPPARKAAGR
ncbi:hypothetical protein [Streptomyces sp. NPDC047070]|uniref:hypothetical protein n=1 Tax=Streptomyces sp. NPDC047070 TaxID=3154923 RepID=UPI003455A4B9